MKHLVLSDPEKTIGTKDVDLGQGVNKDCLETLRLIDLLRLTSSKPRFSLFELLDVILIPELAVRFQELMDLGNGHEVIDRNTVLHKMLPVLDARVLFDSQVTFLGVDIENVTHLRNISRCTDKSGLSSTRTCVDEHLQPTPYTRRRSSHREGRLTLHHNSLGTTWTQVRLCRCWSRRLRNYCSRSWSSWFSWYCNFNFHINLSIFL